MSEYKKMKKEESDPLSEYPDLFKKGFEKDYNSRGPIGKMKLRRRIGNDLKHCKKDVVLIQEKVDPKYITKINNKWS